MAIVFNGTTLNWHSHTIVNNSTTVSSPSSPGEVYFGGTKVFGIGDFSSETTLLNFSLVFDNSNFENNIVPSLQTTYADAFWNQYYNEGPGTDSHYYVFLKPGYRLVTSDGTFTGTASPGTLVDLYEGHSVTGANTSHNGSTSVSLRRDDGV